MAKKRDDEAPPPRLGYSVVEFCEAYGISRASFYNYLKVGIGPRCMVVGSRRIISVAAAEQWRREREGLADAAA